MRGQLQVAPGVAFAVIAPAGFRLLAACEYVARLRGQVLVVTAGTNGQHAGPDDPHYRGCAYDLRSHDLPNLASKQALLQALMEDLLDDPRESLEPVDGGLATTLFWGWLEDAGTPNEHVHLQLRNGREYPVIAPSPTLAAGGPHAV